MSTDTITKVILRTGEWPVTPTTGGKLGKPLRVVRNGKSDAKAGVIALAELIDNFGKAIDNVQIPLSDDGTDHKNITRLNTGFVRALRIVDDATGSKLVATLDFTEPDIREKVIRGTYADVSCGIPWSVTRGGRQYGAALEHVAITNRPFIDGLGPFLAASDGVRAEVIALGGDGDRDGGAAAFSSRLSAAKSALYVSASSPETRAKAAALRAEIRGEDSALAERVAAARDALTGAAEKRDARKRAAAVAAEMKGGPS